MRYLQVKKISKAIFLVFTSSKKLTKKMPNFALASEIGQIKQINALYCIK